MNMEVAAVRTVTPETWMSIELYSKNHLAKISIAH